MSSFRRKHKNINNMKVFDIVLAFVTPIQFCGQYTVTRHRIPLLSCKTNLIRCDKNSFTIPLFSSNIAIVNFCRRNSKIPANRTVLIVVKALKVGVPNTLMDSESDSLITFVKVTVTVSVYPLLWFRLLFTSVPLILMWAERLQVQVFYDMNAAE